MDVEFELGEDVRNEVREAQDAAWADAVTDGRGHFSIRETCVVYNLEIRGAINDYHKVIILFRALYNKKSLLFLLKAEMMRQIIDYAFPNGYGLLITSSAYLKQEMHYEKSKNYDDIPFKVCARKRPLLHFEMTSGLYDAIHVRHWERGIVVHEGRLARNGFQLSMTHHQYFLDRVWDEFADNSRVCSDEIEPLFLHVKSGGDATLLCYGQTGTGKTYTLLAALSYLSSKVVGLEVEVSFFEIYGNKCFDLLNGRKPLLLLSDESEEVHVKGVRKVRLLVTEPGQVLHILQSAIQLRASEQTERNPVSSRSHAVCHVDFLHKAPLASSEGPSASSGCYACTTSRLMLVDLAGSERNYETTKMSAAQHRESAHINLALMSLKDCFRAYHAVPPQPDQPIACSKAVRIPFRASPLTRVLQRCFVRDSSKPPHRTTIVTTLSPSPIDAIHSLNSLHHVVMCSAELTQRCDSSISVEVPICGACLRHVPVTEWTPHQVHLWVSSVEGGRFANLALPPGLDGRGLLALSESSLSMLFSGVLREARQEEEGAAWVEAGGSRRNRAIGKALWAALHRERSVLAS